MNESQDDNNMMYESTTKEFEKLLNGEIKKMRPHTHQNLRDSQKYLERMRHNNDNTLNNDSTFKAMGNNLLNNKFENSSVFPEKGTMGLTFGKKKMPS